MSNHKFKNAPNPTNPTLTISHTIKNNQSKTYGLVYGNVGLGVFWIKKGRLQNRSGMYLGIYGEKQHKDKKYNIGII
jgi:hypothetical protein